jgi:peptidoglycan/xylan/chitin deacetylase (PgdA/CDA1 family)
MPDDAKPDMAGIAARLLGRARHITASRLPGKAVDVQLDRGAVSLCFDDFPRSAWTEAGPVLERTGARATYYIAGCFADESRDGVPFYKPSDIPEIVGAGHEIGCHTFDHHSALEVGLDSYLASVRRNAGYVDTLLPGYVMTSHALPYGHVRLSHRRALGRMFDGVRGVRAATRTNRIDRTLLRAAGIERRLANTIDWQQLLATTAHDKGWLIVFTHGISDNPTPFDTTPEDLEGFLKQASGHGLRLAPVRDVMASLDGVVPK